MPNDISNTSYSIAKLLKVWLCKSLFYCISIKGQSLPQSGEWHIKFPSPLGNRLFSSFIFKNPVFSSVISLIIFRSPLAIFRKISLRIVDSINRKTLWTKTHVFKKCIKRSPSFTYFYSSASVVFIRFIIWIRASHSHIFPYFVSKSFTKTMGTKPCTRQFSIKTIARFYCATFKRLCQNRNSFSAITLAKPCNAVSYSDSLFQNQKTSESSASKINYFCHMNGLSSEVCYG